MSACNWTAYTSAKTEVLLAQFCQDLSGFLYGGEDVLQNPFAQPVLLVPNSGMQRYLELAIAKQLGICAQMTMTYPGHFLWQCYQNLIPQSIQATAENASLTQGNLHITPDKRTMMYRLLSYWASNFDVNNERASSDEMSRLLAAHPFPNQRYFLAEKLTTLFMHYLSDRPALISEWQKPNYKPRNSTEKWQRLLFNELQLYRYSKDYWHEAFEVALESETARDALPPRLYLFGFHGLSQAHQQDLEAIARYVPTYSYTFNPSSTFWYDLVSESTKYRLEVQRPEQAAVYEVGNALLANWGYAGITFLSKQASLEAAYQENHQPDNRRVLSFMVNNLDEMLAEPFDVANDLTLLQALQRDIHHAEVPVSQTNATTNNLIDVGDDYPTSPSVMVNLANNTRREVELLQDYLYTLFETTDILPSEVIVMMPNIGDYSADIHALFGLQKSMGSSTHEAIGRIPYSIANQSMAASYSDVKTFLLLLALIDSDFSAEAWIQFLSESDLGAQLGMDTLAIKTLWQWFEKHRLVKNLFDDSQGRYSSLEKLLDQLLLAYIGGSDTQLGQRQASQYFYHDQLDALIGLCTLFEQIKPFAQLKSQQLTMTKWYEVLVQMQQMIQSTQESQAILSNHLESWYQAVCLADDTALFDSNTVDFATIYCDMQALFEQEALHGPFLSGGVSFCSIVPMRAIPAKVICVLGMNESFPKPSLKDKLDLRLLHPQMGDHNPYLEAKYCFLETLMSARGRLYISYIGVDDKTGDPLLASPLVNDLLSYITTHYGEHVKNKVHHQPVLHGFMADSETSYQRLYENHDIAASISGHINSDSNIVQSSAKRDGAERIWRMSQLKTAFSDPIAFYLGQHYQATAIHSKYYPEGILPESDFILPNKGLEQWRFKSMLIDAGDGETIEKALANQNLLTSPLLTDAVYHYFSQQIDELKAEVAVYRAEAHEIIDEIIPLMHGQSTDSIYFRSHQLTPKGQYAYSLSTNWCKDFLFAWLQHVLLQCSTNTTVNKSTYFIACDKDALFRHAFYPMDKNTLESACQAIASWIALNVAYPLPIKWEYRTSQGGVKYRVDTATFKQAQLYETLKPKLSATLLDEHKAVLDHLVAVINGQAGQHG